VERYRSASRRLGLAQLLEVHAERKVLSAQRAVRKWVARSIERKAENAQIYCSKPWTDLHNFSVDGRMDVCCIATGASQERFAYGNIFKDSFQESWNGRAAREFRRTVNTPDKLPPCQRCPIAGHQKAVVE
jgi:radical SAM protein with 4Fe4S-binding SPASM domain